MVASNRQTSLVSVIIPAYNEEKTIAAVVAAAFGSAIVGEVIVIDDGSSDATAAVAEAAGARVIRSVKNLGKGAAMSSGVDAAAHDVVLFLDADLADLSDDMVTRIGQPVLWGVHDMFVGLLDKGHDVLNKSLVSLPYISGQRALRKSLWHLVPKTFKHQFQVELALNVFAALQGLTVGSFLLPAILTQRVKEEKYGFVSGISRRIGMMKDLCVAAIKLSAVMLVLRMKKSPRRSAAYSYIVNDTEMNRR